MPYFLPSFLPSFLSRLLLWAQVLTQARGCLCNQLQPQIFFFFVYSNTDECTSQYRRLGTAPVTNNIKAQNFSEIEAAGSRGRFNHNPSSSPFRADIPINYPLKPLLDASLDSILRAVSPRTIQSYLTAWQSFFQIPYNLLFYNFPLLLLQLCK